VGQDPNTKFVHIEGILDEWGTIPFDRKTMETSSKGLFAIGDCLPRPIRQIYLSEHDGVVAAKSVIASLK
jgi:thioredoxin reductase